MVKNTSFCKKFTDAISNKKIISYIFLGVGLSMFMLNISSFLSFIPRTYSYYAFDVSVFSSMLIVIYATYVLHYDSK